MKRIIQKLDKVSSSNKNRSFKYDNLVSITRDDVKDLVKNCSHLEKIGKLKDYCVVLVKVNEEYSLKLVKIDNSGKIVSSGNNKNKFPMVRLIELTNIVINGKYKQRRKAMEDIIYKEIRNNYNIVNFIIEEDFYKIKTDKLFIIRKGFPNMDSKTLYNKGMILKGIDDFGTSYLYIGGEGQYRKICKPNGYSMYSLISELRKLGIDGELDITSIIYDIDKGKDYFKYRDDYDKFIDYIKTEGSKVRYKNVKIYDIIEKFSKSNENNL